MLSFNDIPFEGQSVNKIVFKSDGSCIAGNVYVDLRSGSFAMNENEGSDSITLVYTNGEILNNEFEAWLAMYPVSARNFSVTIETEDYYIATEIDAGEEADYAAGVITHIPVVLEPGLAVPKPKPVEACVFQEVKSDLGDFSGKYLIVYNDRAMGTALGGAGYNIAGADISQMKTAAGAYEFPDGEPEYVYTIAKLDGIEPEDGRFNYTIRNETLGYVQASANNYNRIVSADDSSHDRAKWDLRLNAGDGMIDVTNPKATFTSPAVNFSLRWDESSGLFAAFAGAQQKVSLFRLLESGETIRLAEPVPDYSVTGSSFKITWNEVPNADGYKVSVDGSGWSATIAGLEYEQSGLPPETSYTIRVKAVGSGKYSDSGYAEITITTAAEDENDIAETGFPAFWDTAAAVGADGKFYATSGNTDACITTEAVWGSVGISDGRLNAVNWSASGASWLFAVPVEDMSAGKISATLTCRSSDVGPKTFRVLYSEDGDTFTDSGETLTATIGDTANGFAFTPEIEGSPTIFYIKLESVGDALGGGSISSLGHNRLTAISITKE